MTGTLEMNSLTAHFRTIALLTVQASLIQSVTALLIQNIVDPGVVQEAFDFPLFPAEIIHVIR